MDISIERRETVQVVSGGAVVELVVRGMIDAASGPELEHAVAEELRRGGHAIRLDCTDVSFLSSAGIRVLLNVHRAAKAAGGTCLIGAASEPVARVLELMRLAPILREPVAGGDGDRGAVDRSTGPAKGGGDASTPQARQASGDIRVGRVRLVAFEPAGGDPLPATVIGTSDAAFEGRPADMSPQAVPRHAFGLGLAALADAIPLGVIAGEMLAAFGNVFYRPPHPFVAVDFCLGEGGHVPSVRLASGLMWDGVPRGRAGFEPADEEPAVRFDELAAALLETAGVNCLALVVIAEVQGIVGVELIRPLAEATADDHPRSRDPAIVARWLSFSREPAHARHTAVIVAVVVRGEPAGTLAGFVRPLGIDGPAGHAHAVVFPLRPIKRGVVDLATTIADLAASEPEAVMHLLGDPHPVLGSGQSELVRGCCWFAPLDVTEAATRPARGEEAS